MDYSKLTDDTLDKLSRNEALDYSKLNDIELEELTKYQAPSTSQAPKPVTPMSEAPGYGESAARGAAQGLSFGFADEIQAGLESALQGEDYDRRVREIRDQYKAAAEANPITYHGADILSGFALPIGAIGGFATKGASTLGKVARSAGSGAILGGLAGAGTSEGTDASDVAKDVAMGATAGAIAGPVIEGSITGLSNYLGKKTQDIGAIKDIADFFKYGKQGVELTGPENLRKVTAEGKKSIESDLIPELESAISLKNKQFEAGKQAAEAKGRKANIQAFEYMVDQAEKAGADPTQIAKLRRELGIVGKRQEVEVTDPGEYQELLRQRLTQESDKLRQSAYEVQLRNAEKAGQKAFKDAERLNKDALKANIAELKITNPAASDKELTAIAQEQLSKSGVLKDPALAAKEARDKVIADAEAAFKGTTAVVEPVTGTTLAQADIGPNRRVIEEMQGKADGGEVTDLSGRAGKEIEKLADKNSAYAYALTEKENQKAIDKLASAYQDRQFTMSRNDLINELKRTGQWVDPAEAARIAKEQTRLSQQPIDIERVFSPQLGQDVLTARAGEQELISKILPKFRFTKEEYQNPQLGVRDVETIRNFISDMVSKDKQIDFRSLQELQGIRKQTGEVYNDMLGRETAKQALDTDRQVRNSLAEMGVDGLIGDASIENKINLRDALGRLMYKANTAKGANESVKLEEAFKGLKQIYQNNPDKLREVETAFNKVKDKMRQAYLSDITTGHNTFAIDPTSINWTMTAGGKVGMVANEAGLLVNKIANAPVGQLLAQSKKLAEKGYKKYASAFESMSSTDDINKRRALMYTLLQDPGFREFMSNDILGEDNAGQ